VEIIPAKSKWEVWSIPLRDFVERVARAGFQATEIYLSELSDSPAACRDLHAEFGLRLIGQIAVREPTLDGQFRSLERQYLRALEFGPVKINAHLGRDILSFADNVKILSRGCELATAHGVPLCVETHRHQALFQLPETRRYVEALPKLQITADFSHFVCVHESTLEDQLENLAAILPRVRHIHARVGHSEGPQVPDPRAPEWQAWTELFCGWWDQMLQLARERGDAAFTITPEFGPPTYMPCTPFENRPVADAWEINMWMRTMLMERFATLLPHKPT
jgi:sugar phosphate isomerase/epimerase